MKPAALARIILSRIRTNIIASHILLLQCLTRLGSEGEMSNDTPSGFGRGQICVVDHKRILLYGIGEFRS